MGYVGGCVAVAEIDVGAAAGSAAWNEDLEQPEEKWVLAHPLIRHEDSSVTIRGSAPRRALERTVYLLRYVSLYTAHTILLACITKIRDLVQGFADSRRMMTPLLFNLRQCPSYRAS